MLVPSSLPRPATASKTVNTKAIRRWESSQLCKPPCVPRNLLFQQLWGTKSQRQCPQNQLLKTTEAKARPTHSVRAQPHLLLHTASGFPPVLATSLFTQLPGSHQFLPPPSSHSFRAPTSSCHLPLHTASGFPPVLGLYLCDNRLGSRQDDYVVHRGAYSRLAHVYVICI